MAVGTVSTWQCFSTARVASSMEASVYSGSPWCRCHSCRMRPGKRKQTPPVRTDEPPTTLPMVTLMAGESPRGTATVMPPSRQMCRRDSLTRILPYSAWGTRAPSSSTMTRCPASASSVATTAPLAPEPTTTTSASTIRAPR